MRSRTLFDLLAGLASGRSDHPAVVHTSGTTTYGQLFERASAVKDSLRALGVVHGDRVGLLASNRVEWLECFFGAVGAGATVHSINTWVTATELDELLTRADCTVWILQTAFGRHRYIDFVQRFIPEAWEASAPGEWKSVKFPSLKAVVVLDEDNVVPRGVYGYEEWLTTTHDDQRDDQGSASLVSATDPAVVLYTSGSTAEPKAVPLLHYGMIENGFHIGERLGLTGDDRVWLGSPLFWSYGCANALMATFTHGATLVLQEQFVAATAIELIETNQCTAAYLLPTLIHALLADPSFDRKRVASLRTGLTIGSPDVVRLAAESLGVASICNLYGSTEVYGNCCVTPHSAPYDERLSSQGPPLPGVTLRIVNPQTAALELCGTVGEIEVKGYLTPGYIGVDMVATGVFTEDGFYRSGDLGYLDERGWLHYVSRESDMIKTSGINVAPLEVEQCLSMFDGVDEVGVVGALDAIRGELVIAYVVAKSGHHLDEATLIAGCRESLASYKVPARVIIVDDLPKTDTGKLSRKILREQAATMFGVGDSSLFDLVPSPENIS
jgi:fatty-acyl-CoA synthase